MRCLCISMPLAVRTSLIERWTRDLNLTCAARYLSACCTQGGDTCTEELARMSIWKYWKTIFHLVASANRTFFKQRRRVFIARGVTLTPTFPVTDLRKRISKVLPHSGILIQSTMIYQASKQASKQTNSLIFENPMHFFFLYSKYFFFLFFFFTTKR